MKIAPSDTARGGRLAARLSAVREDRRTFALLTSAVGPLLVLLLASPMLLTSRAFGPDWTNHLWFVWKQGIEIKSLLHPTYFAHAERIGIFYPHYAFYGGTMYAIAGGLSALLGQKPVVAYVGVSVAAIGMAYGGWYWLAHQAGMRRWRAHLPALVFTTSAYYLTNLYGRGAWGEFMATSAVPLVAASGIALLRAQRWRVWPSIALVVSVLILGGSHNITLLWSAVFYALAAIVLLIALPRHGREIPLQRIGRVVLLGGLAMGVNLWFLLPDIAYAKYSFSSSLGFGGVPFLDTPSLVFDPIRRAPPESTTPGLFVQLPVLVLGWSLLTLALRWRPGLDRFWLRTSLGLMVILGVLLELVFKTGPWSHLPRVLRYIQFPYRLQTYVVMCVTGLVLAAMVALLRSKPDRVQKLLTGGLVVIVLIGVGQAVAQAWSPRSNPSSFPPDSRQAVFASQYALPPAWVDPGNYRDASAPVVPVPADRTVTFRPDLVKDDRFDQTVHVPAGTAPIATNIASGPYFVRVAGLVRVGRTQSGLMVVRRAAPGRGPVHVTVSAVHPTAIVLGVIGSLVSLGALLVLLVAGLSRSYVRRRR